MGVGQKSKTDYTNLVCSKFLHKMDPKFFLHFKFKMNKKKFDRHIFGRSAAMHLTKTALTTIFFIKCTPFNFDLYRKMLLKIKTGPIWAD